METPPSMEEMSGFDMGISTLGRINYLLWTCNQSQSADDPITWFKNVKVIYKETHAFMNNKEREKHQETIKQVEEQYKVYLNYLNKFGNLRRKPRFTPPRKLFDELLEWEIELRMILDKKGLLMKKMEGAGTAIQ